MQRPHAGMLSSGEPSTCRRVECKRVGQKRLDYLFLASVLILPSRRTFRFLLRSQCNDRVGTPVAGQSNTTTRISDSALRSSTLRELPPTASGCYDELCNLNKMILSARILGPAQQPLAGAWFTDTVHGHQPHSPTGWHQQTGMLALHNKLWLWFDTNNRGQAVKAPLQAAPLLQPPRWVVQQAVAKHQLSSSAYLHNSVHITVTSRLIPSVSHSLLTHSLLIETGTHNSPAQALGLCDLIG